MGGPHLPHRSPPNRSDRKRCRSSAPRLPSRRVTDRETAHACCGMATYAILPLTTASACRRPAPCSWSANWWRSALRIHAHTGTLLASRRAKHGGAKGAFAHGQSDVARGVGHGMASWVANTAVMWTLYLDHALLVPHALACPAVPPSPPKRHPFLAGPGTWHCSSPSAWAEHTCPTPTTHVSHAGCWMPRRACVGQAPSRRM